jgi:hypothetical protein
MSHFLKILTTLALLGFAGSAQATIPASERAVLINLYDSANGANWTNNTGWNGAVGTECTWFSVGCDGTQSHVTSINLFSNNLVGALPSLSALSALQFFSVYNNQLTGSIPSLSGLTALFNFSVYNNQLTGPIPSLSGLTALKTFDVAANQLTGSIPSLSGLTALQFFYVDNNQLTGSIPSLSGLTVLKIFVVNNNQLTGPVPAAPSLLTAGGSNLCGNSLVSSGNSTIDAAWVTAQLNGSNWLACQTASPICTLTAAPASVSVGDTSLLTASCSPAATAYSWSSNAGFGSSTPSGTVSPLATTTYTVTGSNAAGPGNTASATVTVQADYNLSVSKSGTGSGVVTTAFGIINCGTKCSGDYSNDTIVTLTATPAAGSTFTGWSGDCVGTGVCNVTMNAAKSVTATFSQGSSPSCTLTATPASIFVGDASLLTVSCNPAATAYSWSSNAGFGSSTSSGTVSPSATATYTVTGSNAAGPGNTASATVTVQVDYNLSVAKSGTGSGTVTSSSGNINCGSICNASINSGTLLTLTATPATGSTFTGWSGDCVGTGVCNVTMNAAKSVTATFSQGSSPSCTLTATPASIFVGDASLLTVSCNPAATAYSWSSNAGFGSSTSSGTVSPSATATYTVTGSNAAGPGNTASATVTVQVDYNLSVAKSGTGSGTVTSSSGSINCGSICNASINSGTFLTLIANPAQGSAFIGWSGACTGTGGVSSDHGCGEGCYSYL